MSGLYGYSVDCFNDDCDHCEQPDGCDCSCHAVLDMEVDRPDCDCDDCVAAWYADDDPPIITIPTGGYL